MKIKTFFFRSFLNKIDNTLIYDGNASTLVKFKYQCSNSNSNRIPHLLLLLSKMTSALEVKLSCNVIMLEELEGLIFLHKDLKHDWY